MKSFSTIQRPLALCSCPRPLRTSPGWQWSTWRRLSLEDLFRSPRPGTAASVLRGRLRPFSWSDPDTHIAVCCSCCVLFACQWGFRNLNCSAVFPAGWLSGQVLFLFWSHLCEMYSETWVIVHSQWAIHHRKDWIPMTLAPQDNVSFFTKLMVNIWSASSI